MAAATVAPERMASGGIGRNAMALAAASEEACPFLPLRSMGSILNVVTATR